MRLFKDSLLYRLMMVVLFFIAVYSGVKCIDLAIYHFAMQSDALSKGATKITESHFKQPEECVLHNGNFHLFLETITRHKEGILASKPFYVILLGLYLALACIVVIKVMNPENGELPNVET
jgi:hypothetical protein